MVKDDSKEFDFNSVEDEEYEAELYREEIKDLRVEKINQRVTIITILIPCLIGVVLYIAYRDLTGRVTRSEFTGSKEVQALSEELEKKFAGLAAQNTTFQKALDEKIASFEKTSKELNNTLNKINDSVQKLKQNVTSTQTALETISASKVDKKEQAAAVAEINKTLAPIRKEIETLATISKDLGSLSSELKALDKNLKSETASLNASITKTNNDLVQIQNSLAILGDQQIDKESLKASLELEMLKVKKNYEHAIEQAVVAVERKLDTLARRTKLLEQNLKQLEASATKIPFTAAPPKKKSANSGDIVEQDIKE